MASFLPADVILTFPHGPTFCNSTPSSLALRQGVVETIANIAGQCDGVRCDMAMLLLNNVFERTWAAVPGKGR